MKKLLCVVPLALLLCLSFGCQNKAEKAELEKFRAQAKVQTLETKQIENDIETAADTLASAISRLDAEEVTNLFSKIPGTKYITDGRVIPQQELLETFRELYGSLQEMDFIFEKKEVHVFNQGTAVFTGWVTYTAVTKEGQKIDEKAVYTMVYVNENGKWSVFQAHKSYTE